MVVQVLIYLQSHRPLFEQAVSSTTVGHIINLGSTAIAGSAIFTTTEKDATNTGDFLAGGLASIAANSASLLYSAESNTNANIVDTIVNVENVTGGTGRDYIIGSAAANVIDGGSNIADIITTGGGADTVAIDAIAVGGSVVGADTITDFTIGVGGMYSKH